MDGSTTAYFCFSVRFKGIFVVKTIASLRFT